MGPEFKNISSEARDIIKRALTYDMNQRISAEEALNHPWIKNKVNEPVNLQATVNALSNLRHFRVWIPSIYFPIIKILFLGWVKDAASSHNIYSESTSIKRRDEWIIEGVPISRHKFWRQAF